MSNPTSKEESSFAFRFAKMWNDLIGSPVMNTRRYTEAQGMMEEADAEIARLRTEHEEFVLKVAERFRGSPDETTDRELIGKTIAENTCMRVLLRAVTESWVNGRRVLDGIDKTFADQVRLVFGEHSPEHKLVEPIKVGSGLFGVGVPLRLVLERIERGYDYAVRGLVPPAQETAAPLTADTVCSCGKRLGEHPAQPPWWPCMMKPPEKAPVTSAETCPTGDWVHAEHNGKCIYCGAPMPSEKASVKRCSANTGEIGCALVDGHPGPHQFRQQFQSNGRTNGG